jgi:3-methyladenine DNA glycosylase/8-oxoguanine DNA glycosylase
MRLRLSACQPFSLESVAKSHGWIQLAPFSYNLDAGILTYIAKLDSGRVVELQIREISTGVSINIEGTLDKNEKREVKSTINWMLGLDQDFSSFYKLARKEPKLAHMKKKAQGRILRSQTLFEDVIKTILTTNTLWAGTKRMTANLVTQFGNKFPENPSLHAFPTPRKLAKTTEKVLREETRLGYRAPYVLKLAQDVASGVVDLEAFKTADLPTKQLRKKLLALKGVGKYAVANLMILLGRYDSLPIDSWALKVVAKEWYDGKSIGPAEVETAFEQWCEWKGLAYWFWDWSYFSEE